MENDVLNSVKKAIKNWWISLIVGIICIGLGIMCLMAPGATFITLTIFFIAAFLVNGIFDISFAVTNRENHDGWGWILAIGIIDIIFGLILLFNPAIAPVVLAYFIAFWLMFQSFWSIGVSIDLKRYRNSGWGWLLALSIVGLILSIILLAQPVITGFLAVVITASVFIVYGIFRIALSIKLKSFNKYID